MKSYEEKLEYNRQYKKNHKESIKEQKKKYYLETKEKRKEYYSEHRDFYLKYFKNWRQNHLNSSTEYNKKDSLKQKPRKESILTLEERKKIIDEKLKISQIITLFKSLEKLIKPYQIRDRNYQMKIKAYNLINKGTPLICENCGQDNLDFLTIDHSLNNGKEHRKKFGSGQGIYRAINNGRISEEELKTLRIYCYNCNMSRQRTKI